MPQLTSPFIDVKWGWDYGEAGWNVGMDENLVKFSYLFDGNIDGIINSLPAAKEGSAYFLTDDNRVYFVVNGAYYNTPLPKWFKLTEKSTGDVFIFDGTVLTKDTSIQDLKNKVSSLEKAISLLGSETSSEIIKIAVIGDSLSQNSTRNYNWATQACNLIKEMSGKNVQLFNAAIAGSTWKDTTATKQHRAGTKTQLEVVTEFDPDYVICAMGINDAVYIGGLTSSQIVDNATTLVNSLRLSIPNAKIIYAEECPHDIQNSGVNPSSLINNNCIPASHQTITLKGLSNVRVNNSTYLNTSVAPATLVKHQTWGSSTLSIRSLFDGFFSVSIWKMSRMGCMSDNLHIDHLGQTLWAWQLISYLASSTTLNTSKIDFSCLAISTLNTSNINIDLFFSEVSARTIGGNMPSQYNGYNIFQRLSGWMMKSPAARMHTDTAIASGATPLTLFVENALPNSTIYLASDSTNFSNVSRTISPSGNHLQTFMPGSVFTDFRTSGPHGIWLAAVSPDGGSTDVFTASVLTSANYPT